jgi:hypothetical protein
VNRRRFAAMLGVAAVVACNVYDSSLLTGGADAGLETGGGGTSGSASGNAGRGTGGSSGTMVSGGTSGTGGDTSPEGGAAGDDTPTGGATTGGSSGSDTGGAAGSGTTGGVSGATTGGTAGTTVAGAGGTAGASAGAGGAGNAGGAGGASGGGAGGAGAGGAGTGGGGGGGPIVQLTGTATADSEQTNPAHPATHGNDGVTSTRWCAANGNTGHYFTLDLGAVHPLGRFEVIWEYPTSAVGLPYGYIVGVSNDGTTFTTAIDRTTTTSTMQIQTNDFPPATSGRYVRITAVLLPTGAWASFFEARVFGQ